MRESAFQNKIIRKLKNLPECYHIKVWGGGFQKAGIPDLIICYKGYFIAVELKNEIGKPTELQKYHISEINKAKGFALVVRPQNEQELWAIIKEIDDRTATKTS